MARTRQQTAANASKPAVNTELPTRIRPAGAAQSQTSSQATSVVDLPSQVNDEHTRHKGQRRVVEAHAPNEIPSFSNEIAEDDSAMLDDSEAPDYATGNELTISQTPVHAKRTEFMRPQIPRLDGFARPPPRVNETKQGATVSSRINGEIFPKDIESFESSTEPKLLVERLQKLCETLTTTADDFDRTRADDIERASYIPLARFLARHGFTRHEDKLVRLLVADAIATVFRIVGNKINISGPLTREPFNNFVELILGTTALALLEESIDSGNFQLAARTVKNIRESEAFGEISSPTGMFSKLSQKSAQHQLMSKIYDDIVKVVYNVDKLQAAETDADARQQIRQLWCSVIDDLVRLVGDALFGGKHATFPPERIVLAILHEYAFNVTVSSGGISGDAVKFVCASLGFEPISDIVLRRMQKPESTVAQFMEDILRDVDRVEPAVCQVVCTELTKYALQGYMPREKFAWQSTMSLFNVSPLYVRNMLPTLDTVMRIGTEERRALYVITLGTMWSQSSFYAGSLLRQADRQFIETNFLARGLDMHPKVRQQMIACLPGILFEHGERTDDGEQVIEKVRGALRGRLLDPDDAVREATLETISAIIKEASLTTTVDKMPIIYKLFDKELVEDTYGRVRDISAKVRQAASYAASEAYVRFLRALQRANEQDPPRVTRSMVVERFAAFPEFILETFITCTQGADKILIERMLLIGLFSIGARAADAATGQKSQAAADSADERARRFVCLYCSLTGNAWDVFHLLLAYHFRTHEYMRQLLQRIRVNNEKPSAADIEDEDGLNFDASSNEFQRIRMRLEQYHLTDPLRNMSDGYQQLIELVVNNKDAYRYAVQLVTYEFGDDPRPVLKKFRDLCSRAAVVGEDGESNSVISAKKLDAAHKSVIALAGDRIADRIVPFLFSARTLQLVVKYAVLIARKPSELPTLFIPASGHTTGRLSNVDVQKRALDIVGDVLILYPTALTREPDALKGLMRVPDVEHNADLASAAIKVLIKWCKTVPRDDEKTQAQLSEINPQLLSLMRRLVRGSSEHEVRRHSLGITNYSPYVAKEALRFIEEVSDNPLDEFSAILNHLRPRLNTPSDVQSASAVAVLGDMASLIEICVVRDGDSADTKQKAQELRWKLREIFQTVIVKKLIDAELRRSSLPYKTLAIELEQEQTKSNLNIRRTHSDNNLSKPAAVNIDNVSSPRDDADDDREPDEDADGVLDLSEVELDQVVSQMRASQQLRSSNNNNLKTALKKKPSNGAGVDGGDEEMLPILEDSQEEENAFNDAERADEEAEDQQHPSQSTAMSTASRQQINTNLSVLNSHLSSNISAFRPKTALPVRVQTKLYAMRAYGKWASSLTMKRDSLIVQDQVLALFYNIIRVHSKPGTTLTQQQPSTTTTDDGVLLSKRALSELDRCYTVYSASVVLLRLYRRFNPSFGVNQLQCLSAIMLHTACPFNELREKFCSKVKKLSRNQMPVWMLLIFAHGVKLERDANDEALRESISIIMDTTTNQFRQLVMESPKKMARYLPELVLFYAIYYMAHSRELIPFSRPADDRLMEVEDLDDAGGVRHWTGEEPALRNFVRMLNFIIETISRVHPQFTLNAVTVIIQRIKTCHVVVDASLLSESRSNSDSIRDADVDVSAERPANIQEKLCRAITQRAWALADLCNDVLTARFVHRVPGPLLNVDVVEPTSLFKFDSGLNANKMKRTVKNIQAFCRMRAKPYTDIVQIGRPSTLATQSSTQFESYNASQSSTATTIDGVVQHETHREPETPAGGGRRQQPPARRAFTTPKRVSTRRRVNEREANDGGLAEVNEEEEDEDEVDFDQNFGNLDEDEEDQEAERDRKTARPRAAAFATPQPAGRQLPKAKTAKAAFRYLQPPAAAKSSSGKRRHVVENVQEHDDVPADRVLRSAKKSAPASVAVTPQISNKRARRDGSGGKRFTPSVADDGSQTEEEDENFSVAADSMESEI